MLCLILTILNKRTSDFYKSSNHFKTFVAKTAIIVILSATAFATVRRIYVHILRSCVRDIAYVMCEHESFVRAAVSCHATDAWRAYIREIKATSLHEDTSARYKCPDNWDTRYTRGTIFCRTTYAGHFAFIVRTVCGFWLQIVELNHR